MFDISGFCSLQVVCGGAHSHLRSYPLLRVVISFRQRTLHRELPFGQLSSLWNLSDVSELRSAVAGFLLVFQQSYREVLLSWVQDLQDLSRAVRLPGHHCLVMGYQEMVSRWLSFGVFGLVVQRIGCSSAYSSSPRASFLAWRFHLVFHL